MPEGSIRFQIGSFYCAVLADGYYCYPPSWCFPNAGAHEIAQALLSLRLPAETILSPYTCLLIETGRHVVLVDAGAGGTSTASGAILARLEMEGIRPRDVDTVILTHVHPDHIGGAVDGRGRPVFPQARHLVAVAERDFWTAARTDLRALRISDELRSRFSAVARRNLHALRHHIEPLEAETEAIPGIRVIPAPGHTPGHLAVEISSEGRTLLHVGDAATHPLHVRRPDWENGFDCSPQTALATRRALLERATAPETLLMAFHFPFPSIGRIEARPDGGWNWSPGLL